MQRDLHTQPDSGVDQPGSPGRMVSCCTTVTAASAHGPSAWLLRWDRDRRLRPAPIQGAEGAARLAGMSPERRLASWHAVDATGRVWSGGGCVRPGAAAPARRRAARGRDRTPAAGHRARLHMGRRAPRSPWPSAAATRQGAGARTDRRARCSGGPRFRGSAGCDVRRSRPGGVTMGRSAAQPHAVSTPRDALPAWYRIGARYPGRLRTCRLRRRRRRPARRAGGARHPRRARTGVVHRRLRPADRWPRADAVAGRAATRASRARRAGPRPLGRAQRPRRSRAEPRHHGHGQTFALDLVYDPDGTRPESDTGRASAIPRSSPPSARTCARRPTASSWPCTSRARSPHRSTWPAFAYMVLEVVRARGGGLRFVLGNHVVLDLGDDRYAALAHLQRGRSACGRPADHAAAT